MESRKLEEPSKLVSCHLLEIAVDGSLLWSWSYPNMESQLRGICLSKCETILHEKNSEEDSKDPVDSFKFFHIDKLWFYIYLPSGNLTPGTIENLSQVKNVGIIVATEDFHPEKYQHVGEILYLSYIKTGDTSVVLQQFLSLIVDEMCLLPKKKTFSLKDYQESNPYDKHQIKAIISRFGLETILIYTGLMRKRRIMVYHYDIDVLNEFILSLPVLGCNFEKDVWNSIYLWVDLNEEEISYLKNIPFYTAGCTNAEAENRHDLFDIFVNIPAAEITVAPHAKESISMNKTHKEMAMFMVQLASSDMSEDEVVAELTKQSLTVMDKLTVSKNVKS